MSFLNLPPPSLHPLRNHNHTSHSSLPFRPNATPIHRSLTLPFIFRHKFISPKRVVYSILHTDDGVATCSAEPDNPNNDVKIVAIVGEGAVSPLKSASWLDVMLHTVRYLILPMFQFIINF